MKCELRSTQEILPDGGDFMAKSDKARIIREYMPEYPDPIEVAAGERVSVGNEDAEFPGWVWCRSSDGREGWVPAGFQHRMPSTFAGVPWSDRRTPIPQKILTSFRDSPTAEYRIETKHILGIR